MNLVGQRSDTAAPRAQEFLLNAYRRMQQIRIFEQHVQQLSKGDQPEVAGSAHVCAGQEAIPVGALAALRADDRVVATYRGHGWALVSGITPDELMAEICHRAGGINGGCAGSAYVTAPDRRFIGENSIVGAGGPIACGVAMAAQVMETGRVCIVTFGDGALAQGALHEAFVFAAARNLPVIFVCEDNGWSEMTPGSKVAKVERLSRRALGYGIEGVTADGCDVQAVYDAVAAAAKRARQGNGPTLIECKAVRLWGHYTKDIQHYRPASDKAAAAERDPIVKLRTDLIASHGVAEADLGTIDEQVAAEMRAVVERCLSMPKPDPATARNHNYAAASSSKAFGTEASEVELTMAKAISRALHDELESDPRTIVYGEDVGHAGGVFGATRDLQRAFGEQHVFDTPIAESAILGSAVGASLEGMRPIVDVRTATLAL